MKLGSFSSVIVVRVLFCGCLVVSMMVISVKLVNIAEKYWKVDVMNGIDV